MAVWKPSRRLFLAGAGLIAAPAIVRAQSPQIRQLLLKQMPVAVGGAPASSVWGDHGTNLVLSTTTIANDTVTGGAGNSGLFSMVRGTQAYSAGKRYFEIKVITAPGTNIGDVGVMDNTTANGAAMDNRAVSKSAGSAFFNGNESSNVWTGVNLGSAITLSNGDVFGYAADFDNQFYYLAKNNTWFLSGVPTSGALGTGNVGVGARTNAYPSVSPFGTANGVYQLITGLSSFTFTPPSGYSAWG